MSTTTFGEAAADWGANFDARTQLVALALSTARIGGLFYVFPAFTRLGVDGSIIRGGIVLGLSVPLWPRVVAETQAQSELGNLVIMGLLGKEIFIGVLLGLAFGIPFWAAAAVGDLIEFQRGSLASDLIEPGTGEPTTALGTFFILVMTTAFVSLGLFAVFLEGLYTSFDIWPIWTLLPPLELADVSVIGAFVARILEVGLLLSAPLLFLMLVIELVLGVIGRFLPQMNVLIEGMAIKTGILFLLLPIYFIVLAGYLDQELGQVRRVIDELQGFL